MRSRCGWLLAGAIVMAAGDNNRALADEGMWLFNAPPRAAAQNQIRFRRQRKVADALAAVGRPLQQRRIGLVRLGQRAGADEPSRRRRCAAQALFGRARLCSRRLLRQDPGRRGQVPRPGAERAGRDRGRHRSGQRRGQAGAEHGRIRKSPAGGDQHDRERVVRQDQVAQRRGDAVQRRAVPALPVQEIYRRAAGLRPGAADRFFWRRPRQFRISALRSRHLLLPRLRERQAGQGRRIFSSGAPAVRRTAS